MTRDGLVEKNLNDQTTVRVSSRTGDLKLERKEKSGRKESLRAVHLARDEPVAGQKIRSRHWTVTPEKPQRKEKNVSRLRTDEKSAGEGKFKEKEERILAESRGDSRKAMTGGATRPKQKKRLQFAEKETEKSPKQHSNRQKVLTQEREMELVQDIKDEAVNDLNLRIAKILKKTPMEEDDRQNLVHAVDTAAGKVVNKLIFGLRDSLNQEIFLECVAGLEKIYEE